MGNTCGCVRGSKEECYVDPAKAPLRPAAKELSGRRYFQKRRKRKSESLRSPAIESCKNDDADHVTSSSHSVNQTDDMISKQNEDPRPRQQSISHGVYVGEVPVLRSKTSRSAGADREKTRLTVECNLHGVTKSSRSITPKELLGKKLVQRQLRREVSFGAVEHMLQTMRRNGSQRSNMDNLEGLSKMVWDTQVHRKRRRAHTCSGCLVSQSSLDAVQRDPKHASPKHQEVTAVTVIVLFCIIVK